MSNFRPKFMKAGSTAKLRDTGNAPSAAAANIVSPKGIATKTPAGSEHSIGLQRRRLSLMSDNKLVDGMAGASINDMSNGITSGDDLSFPSCIVSVSGMSKKGYAPYNPRKKNQDSMIIQQHPATRSVLLCVLDGHGEAGDGVSNFLRDRYPEELFKHPKFASSKPEDVQTAIGESLNTIEKTLIRNGAIDTEFSGSTAVLTVFRDDLIIVGNVGDSRISRAYYQSETDKTIRSDGISIDHKPDLPEEKARIIASGGRVFAVEYDDGIDGPPRVWLGHMDVPGLAMSRSIGDGVAHTAGVISTPEYHTYKVQPTDKCFVIATDGLWEFMTNDEVMGIAMAHTDPKEAVEQLVKEANRRWMKEEQVVDDTTVIVVYADTTTMKSSNEVTTKS